MTEITNISVVIPTFRRREILGLTLRAYALQTIAADRFEIIIVIDGPDDDVAKMLADAAPRLPFTLRWFALDTNRGPSAARNRALAEARGEIILLTGDDIIPEPGLLAEHLGWHRTRYPEAGCGVLGRARWADELAPTPLMHWLEERGSQFGYGMIDHDTAVDYAYLYTCNISIKKEFLLSAGELFDERLRFFEDSDWGQRLSVKGFTLYYNAQAIANHLHPVTLGDSLARMRAIGVACDRLRTINPVNFRRITGGILDEGRSLKLLAVRMLLHPVLREAVYLPLARLCERRVRADRIFALCHAAFLLAGLLEGRSARAAHDTNSRRSLQNL